MDNIAEGFERSGEMSSSIFINSKGSCVEVKSQLYRALDRKYIRLEQFRSVTERAEGGNKYSSFINYLNDGNYKATNLEQSVTRNTKHGKQ